MSLTDTQILGLKVSDLKQKLSELGQSTTGVKATLQKRLREAVAAAAPAASTGMDTASSDGNDEGTVDESTRYKGTVFKYEYRRGFGLISPEGDEDKKKVYVHWKQIQSSDTWPALTKGMEVEYYLGEKKKFKKETMQSFAANVTAVGGGPVSVTQEDLAKTYPDRSQRFQGTVKFFHARKGYGFIKPNEDFSFGGEDLKAGEATIYVAREDIKTSEQTAPSLKDDLAVEFTLYKRENAKRLGAGDVTLPGGVEVSAADFGKMGPKQNFKNKGGYGPMRGFKKGGMQFVPVPMMNMMGGGGGGMNMAMMMNMMAKRMGGGGGGNWGGNKGNWNKNKGGGGKKSKSNFSW